MMGKLIITNFTEWNSELRKCFTEAGLEEAVRYDSNAFYLTLYKKINIKHSNYYQDGENAIYSAGTFFYKGLFGENALIAIIKDSEKLDVKGIRKNLIGSYVIAIKNNNILKIFIDETHTYAFYYYIDSIHYILTNTYHHIEKCVREKVNKWAFFERGTCSGNINLCTPYNNILKLSAREYISIDLKTNIWKILKCELNNYHVEYSSFEDVISTIIGRVEEVLSLRNKYMHNYLHFMTGGLDSRLELAFNLHKKNSTILGYWRGKDVITNGTEIDQKMGENIAKDKGLSYILYNVSESFEDAVKNASVISNKYGEYASLYAGNSKWFQIFEKLENIEYVGFGYFGETLRSLSELDTHFRAPYSMKKMIDDLYCRSGIKELIKSKEEFVRFIEKEYEYLLSNINKSKLSKDDAYKLFNYLRFDSNNLINNLVNSFTYSFPVLATKKVADAIFDIPYEYRKGDKITLELIKYYHNDLLNYPFYSHHHLLKYNSKKNIVDSTFQSKILAKIKKIIYKTMIYDKLYLGYLQKIVRPESVENQKIFQKCMQIFNESYVLYEAEIVFEDIHNWKGIDMGALTTFASQVSVADTINQKRNYKNVR